MTTFELEVEGWFTLTGRGFVLYGTATGEVVPGQRLTLISATMHRSVTWKDHGYLLMEGGQERLGIFIEEVIEDDDLRQPVRLLGDDA